MRYCVRCIFPENGKPTTLLDDEMICSGCRAQEAKDEIDWHERAEMLNEILDHYVSKARASKNPYDCIIPVSGGKDSHYQVHLVKNVYGMNPLLVTFNHVFNTELGIRNLNNLVKQFNCDIIRLTVNPDAAKKISRYMLKKVGDLTWHYHTGIYTFPFQIAVKYNIPLIVWGEHGFAESVGMFRLEDIPEFTKWTRQEHHMRGVQVQDLVNDEESGVTWQEVAPYIFPTDEDIERVGVRGIYIGNYVRWDHLAITKFLVDEYDFKILDRKRDRTFSLFHKIDDHANDVHDYMKYLKFGYGRGTDHASQEVRAGRMTREQAIEMAKLYDPTRPSTLDFYLDFLEITEEEFYQVVEPMRDPSIWAKDTDGNWYTTDSIVNHIDDPGVEEARLSLVPEVDRTFGRNNQFFYYSDNFEPLTSIDDKFVTPTSERNEFIIL